MGTITPCALESDDTVSACCDCVVCPLDRTSHEACDEEEARPSVDVGVPPRPEGLPSPLTVISQQVLSFHPGSFEEMRCMHPGGFRVKGQT